MYFIDNLIADHRAYEAEKALQKYKTLEGANQVMAEVYRAYIALARFNEPEADRIMEELGKTKGDDDAYLFEAAQYYARKCDYQRAIEFYERSFTQDHRRPRFTDALMGIKEIYEIMGDYRKAAETSERLIDLLENEWGMTEESVLLDEKADKARLLEKISAQLMILCH